MDAKLAVKVILLKRELYKLLLIITFFCGTKVQEVTLSGEHQAWKWADEQTAVNCCRRPYGRTLSGAPCLNK